MSELRLYKLRFLLTVYARDLYRPLAWLTLAGAGITLVASFTAWSGAVTLIYALFVGTLAAGAATLAVLVLNVMLASGMHRGIERFEAAYDAYRRANAIPDIFYEEMDLEEAKARAEA